MKFYIEKIKTLWNDLPASNRIFIILASILIFAALTAVLAGGAISDYKDRKYEKSLSELKASEDYYKDRALHAEEKIENLDAQIAVIMNKLKSVSVEREAADENAIVKRNQAKKSGEIYEKNKINNSKPRLPDDIISDDELCWNGARAGIKPAWCE